MKKVLILLTAIISLLSLNQQVFAVKYEDVLQSNQPKEKIYNVKDNIDIKREQTQEKIYYLKMREKREQSRLNQNKKSLKYTTTKIQRNKRKLNSAQKNLRTLKQNIENYETEYADTKKAAEDRLLSLYKGERLSILNLILSSGDVSTFLDRIYYQKKLSEYDKKTLESISAQQRQALYKKRITEYERSNILGSIKTMKSRQTKISKSISQGQTKVEKIRKSRLAYERAEAELSKQSLTLAKMLGEDPNKVSSSIKATGRFLKPVYGWISSPFGWRRHPIFKSRSFHNGVDIAGANKSPIKASNSGRVIYSGWYGGYGKVVILNHGIYREKPTTTLYAHMSRIAVKKGAIVKKGQTVGYEGSTGYSTGPHLHFEIRLNGKPTNPLKYIPR